MDVVLGLLAGVVGWSAAEYVLHRFAGHGAIRRARGPGWWMTPLLPLILFHEEHLAHHRDPTYFAAGWKKALAALALAPAAGLLGGLSFGTGFAGAYVVYEVVHRRIHTHAPVHRYAAWMRRNHLHHHVSPRLNHGVTSPVWDWMFHTGVDVHPVRLPRALAPGWMLDPETGTLRGAYVDDYVLGNR